MFGGATNKRLFSERDDSDDNDRQFPLIGTAADDIDNLATDEPHSDANLIQQRGNAADISGNPRSHAPGSSQTSADSPAKRQAAVDVEAQASGFKTRTARLFDCCHGWTDQIDFEKWYDWIAYYIPILEWLPKYQCIPPELVNPGSFILRDLFAGLTLASISIPMSLSYASYVSILQLLTKKSS